MAHGQPHQDTQIQFASYKATRGIDQSVLWADFWEDPSDPEDLFTLDHLQAHLGDTAGLVPDHQNKVTITAKRVTQISWLPNTYKLLLHY